MTTPRSPPRRLSRRYNAGDVAVVHPSNCGVDDGAAVQRLCARLGLPRAAATPLVIDGGTAGAKPSVPYGARQPPVDDGSGNAVRPRGGGNSSSSSGSDSSGSYDGPTVQPVSALKKLPARCTAGELVNTVRVCV